MYIAMSCTQTSGCAVTAWTPVAARSSHFVFGRDLSVNPFCFRTSQTTNTSSRALGGVAISSVWRDRMERVFRLTELEDSRILDDRELATQLVVLCSCSGRKTRSCCDCSQNGGRMASASLGSWGLVVERHAGLLVMPCLLAAAPAANRRADAPLTFRLLR